MNRFLIAFLITLIAGFSTIFGYFFIYAKPKKISNYIGISLSFSASIMILISLFELIPEGFFMLMIKYNLLISSVILCILIIVSYFFIEFISKKIGDITTTKNNNLYRVGVLSMLALMVHNLPEGILTFLSTTVNVDLGLKLGLAIMLHNIPEGIAIAVPIYYSTYSRKKAFSKTILSGLSEPLGALIAYLFLYKYLTNTMISLILLFVAGIMISISINDIYKEAMNHSKKSIITGFLLGIVIFIITEFI